MTGPACLTGSYDERKGEREREKDGETDRQTGTHTHTIPDCSCSDSTLSVSIITQVQETYYSNKTQQMRKIRKKSLDLAFSLPISFQELDTPLTQNTPSYQSCTERLSFLLLQCFPRYVHREPLLSSFFLTPLSALLTGN